MKHTITFITALLFSFVVMSQTAAGDTGVIKGNVKAAATKMSTLFVAGEFNAYLLYVHPKVIAMMGGKSQMITYLEKSLADMKEQGYTFRSMEVGEPDQWIVVPTGYQCVVPQTIELKTNDGRLVAKSNLLAISADKGITWHFIDTGGKTIGEIQKVIPEISSKIILTPNPTPLFYED